MTAPALFFVFTRESDAAAACAWLSRRLGFPRADGVNVGDGVHVDAAAATSSAYCVPRARFDGGAWAVPADDATAPLEAELRAALGVAFDGPAPLDAATWTPPPPSGDPPT